MAEQYAPIAKDESFNTTDLTPKNIADVLKDGLQNIADSVKPTADEIPFDNTGTSLVSTDVEGAIKEVNTNIGNLYATATKTTGGQATVTVNCGHISHGYFLIVGDGNGESIVTIIPVHNASVSTPLNLGSYNVTNVALSSNVLTFDVKPYSNVQVISNFKVS